MPQGLQIFDASGVVVLDTNFSITRLLGGFNTGVTDGSINIPGFAGARPFIYAVDGQDNPNVAVRRPQFTVTSSGVSWTFNTNGPNTYQALNVLYGTY